MGILVTGGCGYIGSALIPELLNEGYKVTSIDRQFFGNFLPKHKNLKNIKMCVSKIKESHLSKIDIVIHLAAISNDPAALLNPKITWETNVLYTLDLLKICKNKKIKKFIFTSSGSVYGVSKKKKVDEKADLVPISDYNKTKMVGEKIVKSYDKYFDTIILRPGTVCGVSDSLRLDLTVNAMTFSALRYNKINVNGGSQIRPQVNIKDMIRAYLFFLNPHNKNKGTFNIGFENHSILHIANMIKKKIPLAKIKKNNSADIRSYRLYSQKILNTGFKPNYSTAGAINDFIVGYKSKKIRPKFSSLRAVYLKKHFDRSLSKF